MRVCPVCGQQTPDDRCPADGLQTLDAALLTPGAGLIGQEIGGRYRIEARLGAGGFGAVYRARHRETGGAVALKVLHRTGDDDADAVKRFALEAQNAAALTSAHTVRVLDFGADAQTLYLVMELLDGEPLDARLRRGPLPWREAALITTHVLDALAEAHEHPRRIVHRDIKAPNVFLCSTRLGRVHAKVIDFGIARALEGTGAGTRGAIGTPHAMAPEQWRGAAIDGRTDLYALGALLYEMLCGQPPFAARADASPSERMMQLARAHVADPVPPLSSRAPPAVPTTLVTLVHQMLEKEPERRPPSARAVLSELDRLLAAGDSGAITLDDTLGASVALPPVAAAAPPPPPPVAAVPPPVTTRPRLAAPSAARPSLARTSPPLTAATSAPPVTARPPVEALAVEGLAAKTPAPLMGAEPASPAPPPPPPRRGVPLALVLAVGGIAVVGALVIGVGGWVVRELQDGDLAIPTPPTPPAPPMPTAEAVVTASEAALVAPAAAAAALAAQVPGPGAAVAAPTPGAAPAAFDPGPATGSPPAPSAAAMQAQVAAAQALAADEAWGGADEDGGETYRYVARLGQGDHVGANGAKLLQAWQVLLRDRERVGAGHGDAEDAPMPFGVDAEARAMLTKLFRRAKIVGDAGAIVQGTPMVVVELRESGTKVTVLRDPIRGTPESDMDGAW